MHLCALPQDVHVIILRAAIAADPRGAANFLTCCKQLWHSPALSRFVAKLDCDACSLEQRILSFPTHGGACIQTLVIRPCQASGRVIMSCRSSFRKPGIMYMLRHMRRLFLQCDILRAFESLPRLMQLAQHHFVHLQELHISACAQDLDVILPSDTRGSPLACFPALKHFTLQVYNHEDVLHVADEAVDYMSGLTSVPAMFPGLQVLDVQMGDNSYLDLRLYIPPAFYSSLGNLSSLHTLRVEFTRSKSMPVSALHMLLLGGVAPNLRHLELSSVSIQEPSLMQSPLFMCPLRASSRLSTLQIHTLNYGAARSLLPLLPLLPELTRVTIREMDLHVGREEETRAVLHHLAPWPNGSDSLRLWLRADPPSDTGSADTDHMMMPLIDMDQAELGHRFMRMTSPLRESAFGKSIASLSFDPSGIGSPRVVPECAAVFPNISSLEWHLAYSDRLLLESALVSTAAWPRLKIIRIPGDMASVDKVDDLYVKVLPVLSHCFVRGREMSIHQIRWPTYCSPETDAGWEYAKAQWERIVSNMGFSAARVKVVV